jgi:hypothetical protein
VTVSDDRYGLHRDRRGWDAGRTDGSTGTCPLCDRPAAVKELHVPGVPVYRLLVLCDSCFIYHLTKPAETILSWQPLGRAVLADRARRIFAATGEPMEIDVEAVEGVAELFRDVPGT